MLHFLTFSLLCTWQLTTFVRHIVGSYGTLDYVEVVATARGFQPLQTTIGKWRRRWAKKHKRRSMRSGHPAQDVSSPQMLRFLHESLQHRFRALDPECTGQVRVRVFRRTLAQLDLVLKGKLWDALLCMVADAHWDQAYVVQYADAIDVLTGGVDTMAAGRRKIRLAVARFRRKNGSLSRIFPHATASTVSEVVTRLGLAIQPLALSNTEDGPLNARQLQRLSNVVHVDNRVATVDSSDSSDGGEKAYAGLNLEQQFQHLQRVKLMRAQRKRAVAESLLQQSSTTRHFVYPHFGHVKFFEFTLSNTFSTPETVRVDIDDPLKEGALQLVTNAAEWYAHRRAAHHRFQRQFSGRVEEDMFSASRETQIGPRESIQVPFVFCSLRAMEPTRSRHDKRVISVVFRCTQRHVELARLDVHIVPQGVISQRTIRLFPQEGVVNRTSFQLSQLVPVDRLARTEAQATAANLAEMPVVTNSADVVVERRHQSQNSDRQTIILRYRCKPFPAVHSFFLVLYVDQHRTDVFGVFRVVLHSATALGLSATLGETVRTELVCRASRWPRHARRGAPDYCRLYSTRSDEVSFAPAGDFKLDPLSPPSTVLMKYRPQTVGTADETTIVTLVNKDVGQVLAIWRINATIRQPQVSQELSVHVRV